MRREEIKGEDIVIKNEERLITNSLVSINIKDQEFNKFVRLYDIANTKLIEELYLLKAEIKDTYGYDIINSITGRIKTPQSIINKMKKKQYELNYKNLVHNIDDIAGIRITCPFKNDIFTIRELIYNMEDIRVIEDKDYITNPKQSGYSAYHLIVEVPIEFKDKEIYIKCEIQIRTVSMDSWATAEHQMRYKAKEKISWINSKRLSLYAKIINLLDSKLSKLYVEKY